MRLAVASALLLQVAAIGADGPFTVFAPTDAAFRKLPDGAVEDLLKPGNRERLKAVLL